MLIEIRGQSNAEGILSFDIPKLSLDRRFNYKVGLRHLNLKFLDKGQSLVQNELLCLTSNLVDLSSRNPLQSLFIFKFDGDHPIIDIVPPIIIYNPVQLYEVENSSFAVRNYFEDREIKLTQIFIHLEFLRLDTYGRLQ